MKDQIKDLQKFMQSQSYDFALIASQDAHLSEYVADCDKFSEYLSGCTSDNVRLLVACDSARLWTDGRYFLSAEEELRGSGITLMRIGEPGVPTVEEVLQKEGQGKTLALDGRTFSMQEGERILAAMQSAGGAVISDCSFSEILWDIRPARPAEEIFVLPEELAGASAEEKMQAVRREMEENGVDALFISALDDICWLTNLRGQDITCNPVMFSYFLLERDAADIFLQESSLTEEVRRYLDKQKISIRPYAEAYVALRQSVGRVQLDPMHSNLLTKEIATARGEVLMKESPTVLLKAVKNETEIRQSKEIYLQDSAALCRFLCRMEKEGENFDEQTAANLLDGMRAELPGFLELSFPTISAYGRHAALPHYSCNPANPGKIERGNFYLVDSGGQYLGGTTDVTRTIPIGEITEEMRRDFTLVAVANLRLLNAQFKRGTVGSALDKIAREALQAYGLDYNHGTGHGIGYILNVHEGPQRIAKKSKDGSPEAGFLPGMIVSDEPGVYIEDSHGIRTETILLSVADDDNPELLHFEPLTLVPINTSALDKTYMTPEDVELLNNYHAQVRSAVAPLLSGEELEWFMQATELI